MDANHWAYSVVKESGSLTFVPLEDKKHIWNGVIYLYGVDTMEKPEDYLNTEADIRTAMHEKVDNF